MRQIHAFIILDPTFFVNYFLEGSEGKLVELIWEVPEALLPNPSLPVTGDMDKSEIWIRASWVLPSPPKAPVSPDVPPFCKRQLLAGGRRLPRCLQKASPGQRGRGSQRCLAFQELGAQPELGSPFFSAGEGFWLAASTLCRTELPCVSYFMPSVVCQKAASCLIIFSFILDGCAGPGFWPPTQAGKELPLDVMEKNPYTIRVYH